MKYLEATQLYNTHIIYICFAVLIKGEKWKIRWRIEVPLGRTRTVSGQAQNGHKCRGTADRTDIHATHTCNALTLTQNSHPYTHLFVSHGHILYVCVRVYVCGCAAYVRVCVFSFSNKLPSIPASLVNNMTDEQLQDWHTTFLSEAQRENYVNHNLEIVRHYRTEAIARAPAFDLERNAIDAAIARHGLYVSSANVDSSAAAEGAIAAGSGTSSSSGSGSGAAGGQDEVLPPPQRRPRIDGDPTCSTSASSSSYRGGGGPSSSATSSSSTPGTASNYGHFVALQHIFDSYATRAEPPRALGAAFGARVGAPPPPTANGNGKDHSEAASSSSAAGGANVSDMAISKTIDSLGLRRTH